MCNLLGQNHCLQVGPEQGQKHKKEVQQLHTAYCPLPALKYVIHSYFCINTAKAHEAYYSPRIKVV